MKYNYTLVDGIERSRENPTSFFVPHPDHIASLAPGDWVKLGVEWASPGRFNGERFWVRVTGPGPRPGSLLGKVEQTDMQCSRFHGILHDDILLFEARHVLSLQPARRPHPGFSD